MSLLDALLLDPYRDSREVWIALRADGQRGSGTLDDPYDGGTRLGPSLDATLTFNQQEFVVGLFNHGLSASDPVAIRGVQAPGDTVFNGPFTVHQVLSPSHFTILLSSVPSAPPNARYSYTPAIQANLEDCRLYWPVAKVNVPANHGLTLFDGVNIGGAALPADYAGDYPVLGPNGPSGTAFDYRLKSLPGAGVATPINCTGSSTFPVEWPG